MISEGLSGGKKDHCRSNKKKRKLGIKPVTNGIKSYRRFALAVVTAAVAFTQGKSIISSHFITLNKTSSFPPNSRRFLVIGVRGIPVMGPLALKSPTTSHVLAQTGTSARASQATQYGQITTTSASDIVRQSRLAEEAEAA